MGRQRPSEGFWVGLSHFLPGGGTTHEGTPLEKVYVVVRGEITVVTDETEATLGPFDSCHIPAGEARTVVNRTNDVASMIVVMPYPDGQPVTTLPRPASVFDLTGRSAVVTGATGAFGEQAAYALAGAGAHVTLAGGNTEKLQAVARGHRGRRRGGTTVARRPATEQDVEEIVASAAAAGGGLDIVVAGSGTNMPSPIVDQDPADWDAVMDANVRQSWLLCRAAGRVHDPPGPRRQGHPDVLHPRCARAGQLHGLLPVEGRRGPADQGAGGGVGAARDQRQRHRPDRLPVGPHRRGCTPRRATAQLVRENMLRRIPLGRLGEPTDFHGAVQLLASSASDFMTGSVVYLDGGYTAG